MNNAGTDGEFGPVAELTAGKYASTFDTNVLGTLLSMKHELRVMQEQGSGSIVNASSIYGQKGFPNASLYVASKHAIIGLTKSAALEAIRLRRSQLRRDRRRFRSWRTGGQGLQPSHVCADDLARPM